jgi:4-hydroxybenzoate polyprenyltransferase
VTQPAGLVRLLRPKQWIKNGFVFAPLVFAGVFTDTAAIGRSLLAFALFCAGSSAAYIVNDLHDVPHDRLHPKKSKTRPLAAGTVTPAAACVLLAILYAVLVAGWFVEPGVVQVIAAYLVLNVAYTFVLKHQPVIDIFVVAIGFVLRVFAGGIAVGVPVSSWMFITTLCLALYLAAVKRRQELKQGTESRKVLKAYSVALVERYAEIAATGALVFYSMFVVASRPQLVVTIPLVIFGLFRYWYVVEEQGEGESPTDALLADWQLLATVVLWIGVCAWALWPHAR